MSQKLIFLLLLNISYECFAQSSCPQLYQKARAITLRKKHKSEQLYKKFNIGEDDFEHRLNVEDTPPSASNRRANALVEYRRLVKKKGEGFHSCLYKNASSIPEEDRCELADKPCDPEEKYTRLDGYCNNLKKPNLGRQKTAYVRMLEAAYSDGVKAFRKTRDGKNLPNVRRMSNLFVKTSKFMFDSGECGNETNNMAGIFFSQFVAHDTTDRNVVQIKGTLTNGIRCCDSEHEGPLPKCFINPDCKPIKVPKNDKFYAPLGIHCLNFVRMQATLKSDCGISYEHENRATSFLDLNVIYGKTLDQLARSRRNIKDGLFNLDPLNLAPLNETNGLIENDHRAFQTPGIALIHTGFYRLHNIFARELKQLNPHWDDYRLFWEARRILIACYQHIIYYDWLKVVLSRDLILEYKLNCLNYSNCEGYDDTVDPSTLIEYSTNAFRWYHAFVEDNIELADDNGTLLEKVPLSDTYRKLDLLITRLKDLANGLMAQKQRMREAGYSDQIRNLFFKTEYRGQQVGIDLFVFDMLRSRDAGSPSYIHYFPKCAKTYIESWRDIKPFFEPNHYKLLRKLYKHVADIELYAGILLEKRCNNLMGPIGGCLVAQQFFNFRFGDRFFYSHPNIPYKFTPDQLEVIRNATLSRFICMTCDVKQVPNSGFEAPSSSNPYISCEDVGRIRLDSFKEMKD